VVKPVFDVDGHLLTTTKRETGSTRSGARKPVGVRAAACLPPSALGPSRPFPPRWTVLSTWVRVVAHVQRAPYFVSAALVHEDPIGDVVEVPSHSIHIGGGRRRL